MLYFLTVNKTTFAIFARSLAVVLDHRPPVLDCQLEVAPFRHHLREPFVASFPNCEFGASMCTPALVIFRVLIDSARLG